MNVADPALEAKHFLRLEEKLEKTVGLLAGLRKGARPGLRVEHVTELRRLCLRCETLAIRVSQARARPGRRRPKDAAKRASGDRQADPWPASVRESVDIRFDAIQFGTS